MRIARFLSPTGPRLGLVLADDRVVDLATAAQEQRLDWFVPAACDLRLFVAGGVAFREMASAIARRSQLPALEMASLRLLAPFEAGSKILAHVVNYYGHDKEAKVKVPAKPFFFQKPSSSVANPGDTIIAHRSSHKLDHEVEIGILIGRGGRNIDANAAFEHVAGYMVLNDVSYRDFQMNDGYPDLNTSYGKNWTQAKGLDAACPMGPLLVLTDEMPEPYPLRKQCRVNGKVRQDANSAEMIHKVPALIAEVSKGMTLWPGDVIATGTPAGGGLGDGIWLKPGDVVECEVERLGVLRNVVAADMPD
jgi:2-keto-4-pentenoate hydratase/2-oxohepta-3-ene-1,7-dioic acid hydratase in catechol pathway